MGGLWKLAAMSAVIGAGLVVVWQARQGLQIEAATPALAQPEVTDAPPFESSKGAGNPSAVTLTPVLASPAQATSPVVNASVPPEDDEFFRSNARLATARLAQESESLPTETAAADEPSEAVVEEVNEEPPTSATSLEASSPALERYSRGLDFRRSANRDAASPTTDGSSKTTTLPLTASGEETGPSGPQLSGPQPLQIASTDEAIPLLPTPDNEQTEFTGDEEEVDDFANATPSIELTAGQQDPAEPEDNFMAAPPVLKAPSRSVRPAAAVVPEPAEEADPFGASPQPANAPATTAVPAASTPTTESEDPFGAAAPALPVRKPPSRAPLPTNLDDDFPPTEKQPQPAAPALPTDLDPFDHPPAAPQPARGTAPATLPLEPKTEKASAPAQPALPSTEEADDFDPFGAAAPPAMPARGEAAAEPDPFDTAPSTIPAPAPAAEAPARSVEPAPAVNELRGTPAAPSRTEPAPAAVPANPGIYQGDGELHRDSPRGVQEPRLTIEKFAPASAVLGQPVVYSVIVKNLGGSPAHQVTVEDRIPKGSRLVGTAPQAEMMEKRLLWRKLGTLLPGEERKISIKVIPEEEGPIGSVAKVSFVAEVAAEIVVHAPKLTVKVNSPSEAKVGEAIPLIFTISNPGNGDASNVILRSIIPEGLQHPAGNDLEYSVGTLAAKESREVRLEVTAMKPGRVTQETIVTADGNVSSKTQAAVDVVGEQLLLTRSGHDRVYLGRNAIFTNSVTNEGERPVAEVRLQEGVPPGFEFVVASDQGQYDAASRTVSWKLAALPKGGVATVSVTLVAKEIGSFDTTVQASGPSGSTASVKPTISIEGYPALAMERVGEERLIGVGETMTTKIQLQNRGTAAATRVGVSIDLPTELTLMSATGPARYRVDGQRVIFDPVDEVAARGSVGYELVLQAKAAGDCRLEAQISADHLRRPIRHDEAVQVLPGVK